MENVGSEVTIGEIMKKKVIFLPQEGTVKEAAKLMKENRVGSVVIVEGSAVRGIVTERDIVRKVVAKGKSYDTKVEEIMSSPVIVATPDTTIDQAARVMKEEGIRKLPIIDKNGYLQGIVTSDDIVRVFPSIVELIEEEAFLTS